MDLTNLIRAGSRAGTQIILPANGPVAEPMQPVIDDEDRVDLAPRRPEEIALLVKTEGPEDREKRIINDKLRYLNMRSRRSGL